MDSAVLPLRLSAAAPKELVVLALPFQVRYPTFLPPAASRCASRWTKDKKSPVSAA